MRSIAPASYLSVPECALALGIGQIVLTQLYRASAVCDVLEVSRSGVYA